MSGQHAWLQQQRAHFSRYGRPTSSSDSEGMPNTMLASSEKKSPMTCAIRVILGS